MHQVDRLCCVARCALGREGDGGGNVGGVERGEGKRFS